MSLPLTLTLGLLQGATLSDTVITRVLPQRDLFDWTSGILQVIVLVLGIGLLIALILLLFTLRAAVTKVHEAIDRLSNETRPLIQRATGMVDDAREVVAMVKTDVERVTDAASLISDQLLDAAEVTSQRVDEVNAVLDVLQAELESAAIGTVSAIRGVRVGTAALSDNLSANRLRRGSASYASDDDEFDDDMEHDEFEHEDLAVGREAPPA